MTASKLSLDAGFSKNHAGQLERGSASPRLPTCERLARVLGVSAGWLAYGLGEAAAPADQGPLLCEGLAQRAREARTALGLSIREVERRADGSEGVVRAIEAKAQPSLDTLEVIARALQVSPAWLGFGEGPVRLPRRGARPAAESLASELDRRSPG